MKKYIPKTKIGNCLNENKRYRILVFTLCGFIITFLYAFYNGILGIVSHSIWFITLFAYYLVLSAMRFGTVLFEYRNISQNRSTEVFIMRFCGFLLIVLAFILSGSIYLSLTQNIAIKHQEIVMITIATYTFYKIIIATVNIIKIKKDPSLLLNTIRNIGCADAAVSVLSLQRSMLISFDGKSTSEIYVMNSLTGGAVFLFILLLGIRMILKKTERNNQNGKIKIDKSK